MTIITEKFVAEIIAIFLKKHSSLKFIFEKNYLSVTKYFIQFHVIFFILCYFQHLAYEIMKILRSEGIVV
jgi:hypothetical protein